MTNASLSEMIVNFTPTGMIPTKEMTSHVPLSPSEIIEDVCKAYEQGITMVHIHARNAEGKPSLDPGIYGRIIEGVREHTQDLVVCVSLSGRLCNDDNIRAAPLDLSGSVQPDMGSLTLSSLNFNKTASINEPNTIIFLAQRMRERGIKPELEVFDTGMINFSHYLMRKGILTGRQYFNLIVGNIASAQPTLLHMGMMIQDLPEDSIWSLGGVGNCQAGIHAVAAATGGGIRVGLEDNIWYDPARTRMARNIDLVRRAHDFASMCGRKIMSPTTFRSLLGLKRGYGEYGCLEEGQ
jgi:uncharacterized protein (DUF849 family)